MAHVARMGLLPVRIPKGLAVWRSFGVAGGWWVGVGGGGAQMAQGEIPLSFWWPHRFLRSS